MFLWQLDVRPIEWGHVLLFISAGDNHFCHFQNGNVAPIWLIDGDATAASGAPAAGAPAAGAAAAAVGRCRSRCRREEGGEAAGYPDAAGHPLHFLSSIGRQLNSIPRPSVTLCWAS